MEHKILVVDKPEIKIEHIIVELAILIDIDVHIKFRRAVGMDLPFPTVDRKGQHKGFGIAAIAGRHRVSGIPDIAQIGERVVVTGATLG